MLAKLVKNIRATNVPLTGNRMISGHTRVVVDSFFAGAGEWDFIIL